MANLNAERRLERDSVLRCPHCHGTPYTVFRRQNQERDGTLRQSFETVLWPAHPNVDPPVHPERVECPDCHAALRRGAP